MIGRTSGFHGRHSFKSQLAQIELFYKYVNDPNGIVFSNIVLQLLKEQGYLGSVCTLNESLNLHPRLIGRKLILPDHAFLHGLGRSLPRANALKFQAEHELLAEVIAQGRLKALLLKTQFGRHLFK